MSSVYDFNRAIQSFSNSFGNRMKALHDYCRECSYQGSVDELAEQIRKIQAPIFNLVWERSEKKRLTTEQVREITHEFLEQNNSEVNDVGKKAIFQWVIWMAWHEGCVAYDPVDWKKDLAT